jgi:hypothetical protein
MGMITVGCSHGHDATAWSTQIANPNMRGLQGNGIYEAIECKVAPMEGRSGGGLFTSDGYVAGVCDFAEPRGDHGLYAAPRSIYHILDRNKLAALYAPVRTPGDSDRLLAENGQGGRARTRPASAMPAASPLSEAPVARGQSPDRDEPGGLTMPPPELLGIKAPAFASNSRLTWHATPVSTLASATDLKLDPSLDTDKFAAALPAAPDAAAPAEPTSSTSTGAAPAGARTAPGKWRAVSTPLPAPVGSGSD